MRNTITLRFGCAGLQFKNPTTRQWQPTDRETATAFLRNVLNYSKLPEGPVKRKVKGARA
jgi:hypothetical protein